MNGSARGTALVVALSGMSLLVVSMALAWAAAWLWQHRSWGYLVIGEVLVMLVLESTGIAADQWYGRAADPGSPVGSAAFTPLFVAPDRTFAP